MVKPRKDSVKPKGKTTAYAFFMQATREERKLKNPEERLTFSEFSMQASEKWKNLSDEDKKKYQEMAAKDSERHKDEMANYVPSDCEKKRKTKDPNAPKKALSAFFCFSNEERSKVKAEFPAMSVGEVAKELGKRWGVCDNKELYHNMAIKDKERYEKEKTLYAGRLGESESTAAFASVPVKKSAVSKKIMKVNVKTLTKKREAQTEDEIDDNEKEPAALKKTTKANKPAAKKRKAQIEDGNDQKSDKNHKEEEEDDDESEYSD